MAAASHIAKNDECSICLEQILPNQSAITLKCQHQFHKACLAPWLEEKGSSAFCPLCKKLITSEERPLNAKQYNGPPRQEMRLRF